MKRLFCPMLLTASAVALYSWAIYGWTTNSSAAIMPMARAQNSVGRASNSKMTISDSHIEKNEAISAVSVINQHPAAPILKRIFPVSREQFAAPAGWEPSGVRRADYLTLLSGNVGFFQRFLSAEGAIIDPYEKVERQYATPAFALAAALLVERARREDLLEPASRAFSFALAALVNKTSADNHADFYIPMLMHAHRILAPRVDAARRELWVRQMKSLVPEKTYRDVGGGGNWNIVNVAGEALRRKDGLVDAAASAAQMDYLERSLEKQQKAFTPLGMYADAHDPLAYDAFPRLWLEDMVADGAYQGAHRASLEKFLAAGGLSTLLLLSPSGEWAAGGRSAHHQWNEAEVAVICEINARRWHNWGRSDIAGAFKRAAHLALLSMRRWQRPSGELWIVKNYADPQNRHGYEGYSFHSQYNLLAMAMLAIAYERADDSIAERPLPAETSSYVFDLRDPFHKIVACAGGTYIEVETGADPTYDATGLMRVQRAGVALSPYSSNASPLRYQGPKDDTLKIGITPGLEWKTAKDTRWRSLAETRHGTFDNPNLPALVQSDALSNVEQSPQQVSFSLRYNLKNMSVSAIEEQYRVNAQGVEVTTRLPENGAVQSEVPQTRLVFPALVSDGARDAEVAIEGQSATIRRRGGALNFRVLSPANVSLALVGPRVATRNGYVRALVAELPTGTREARWSLNLLPDAAFNDSVTATQKR